MFKNRLKFAGTIVLTCLCLCACGDNAEEKEPNPMAKGMSWIKTNVKMGMDNSDKTVADLITDGCNMGIKSLYKYLNQYKNADEESKKICNKLIDIEETLRQDLRNQVYERMCERAKESTVEWIRYMKKEKRDD